MAAYGTMLTRRLALVLILLAYDVNASEISHLRRCADKACQVTISRATALARYPANSPLHLAFNRGDIIEVKSKSAGSKPELWGGELNGQRGYFPHSFVREFDVKVHQPMFEVPTEESEWTKQLKGHEAPISTEEKEETEIDETDITGVAESVLTSGEIKTLESNDQNLNEIKDTQSGNTAPNLDKEESAPERMDPLLQGIQDLHKSFQTDFQQSTKAFNDYLSQQFKTSNTDEEQKEETDNSKQTTNQNVGQDNSKQTTIQNEGLDNSKQASIQNQGLDNSKQTTNQVIRLDNSKQASSQNVGNDNFKQAVEIDSSKEAGSQDVELTNTGDETEFNFKDQEKNSDTDSVKSNIYINDISSVVEMKIEDKSKEDHADEIQTVDNGEKFKDSPYINGVRELDDTEIEEEKPEIVTSKSSVDAEKYISNLEEPSDETEVADAHDFTSMLNTKESKEIDEDFSKAAKDETEVHVIDESKEVHTDDTELPDSDKTDIESVTVHSESDGKFNIDAEDKGPSQTHQEDSATIPLPDIKVTAAQDAGEPGKEANSKTETRSEDYEGTELYFRSEINSLRDKETSQQKDTGKEQEKDYLDVTQQESTTLTEIDNLDMNVATENIQTEEKIRVSIEGAPKVLEPNTETGQAPLVPPKTVKDTLLKPETNFQPVDINFIKEADDHMLALESSQGFGMSDQKISMENIDQASTPSLEHGTDIKQPETGTVQQTDILTDQKLTTVIDGTTFYLEDGELADVVPESVIDVLGIKPTASVQEASTSFPPAQSTVAKNINPSASTLSVEASIHQPAEMPSPTSVTPELKIQASQNFTESSTKDFPTLLDDKHKHLNPDVDIQSEHYQTKNDLLSRKVLSVGGQTSGQIPSSSKQDKTEEPVLEKHQEEFERPSIVEKQQATLLMPSLTAESVIINDVTGLNVQPSTSVNTDQASLVAEAEANPHPNMQISPDGTNTPSLSTENQQPVITESVTQPPEPQTWDSIPPPPVHEAVADFANAAGETEPEQVLDGSSSETNPYNTDDFYSRKISDEDLERVEAEASVYDSRFSASSLMRSMEVHSKAFIDKLPLSVQSLLEQEPLGLSPSMTVLVTMTTMLMLFSIACFSCLFSGASKNPGKKDPLAVVRELEEKLLLAVKEKENFEDLLLEQQSANRQLKEDFTNLQKLSGTEHTDLHNANLHNEALKASLATLQKEVEELQDRMKQEAKVREKKTKEYEKESKKLQDAKNKFEKDFHKKETECHQLMNENENMKTTIQSLTDQVQLLDTSKQQLLSEAEDWKEKVDELKERLDQIEQEFKRAQESISFKDNELEVLKECYVQLKAFQKGSGEDDEEYDAGSSEAFQEKIQTMMDVSKVNATLRIVQEEKDILENKLKIENDARQELEEQLECVRREMESSMADKMKAERQCQEAQTKLSVLSSYFKEKELQLQRELGEHEALKKQNLSKLDNADQNSRTYQKELELCKQQAESLKRELAASERDFRSQIAANEKKAHENWLNARAAERELKEARHDAAVLRQKLTELERRHVGPGGLIRPMPTHPQGTLNGPPQHPTPGLERSPSRGTLPPFRDDDFSVAPRDRRGLPPSHPALHMPPLDARSPPLPRMHPDNRSPPPGMPPLDARSPPPRIPPHYDRRGPLHPMDRASPPVRLPPPDMMPPVRGHLPPHIGGPVRSPLPTFPPRLDPREGKQGPGPYTRQAPHSGESKRHQSHV